jgi:hypothetical protein
MCSVLRRSFSAWLKLNLTAFYYSNIYTTGMSTEQWIFQFDLELTPKQRLEFWKGENNSLFFVCVTIFLSQRYGAAAADWSFSEAAGWAGGSPWRRRPPSAAPSPRTSGPPAAQRARATTCRSPTPPPQGPRRRPSCRPRFPPARSLLHPRRRDNIKECSDPQHNQ